MAHHHQFRNGIVSAPRPLVPPIGCYVRQLIHKVEGGTCLPWYFTPPSANLPQHVFRGLGAGVVFGPVHEVEEHGSFISVKVPVPTSLLSEAEHRELPQLVWLNVYTNRHRGRNVSQHYCEVVPESEVILWRDRGWKDTWVQQ